MTVDLAEMEREVERAVAELNTMMASHAGHIVLEGVSPTGVVSLRFDAFCAGCLYRPATMAATIRPRLLAVPGVTDVEAPGTRVSEQAARRMVEFGFGLQPRADLHLAPRKAAS